MFKQVVQPDIAFVQVAFEQIRFGEHERCFAQLYSALNSSLGAGKRLQQVQHRHHYQAAPSLSTFPTFVLYPACPRHEGSGDTE